MCRKIIHSFKSKEQMKKVLDKIEEYQWAMWQSWINATSCNPYDKTYDSYLCINDDKLTVWNNFHGYHISHWKDDILYTAEDYLNPINIWDKVEVTHKLDHILKVWSIMYVDRIKDNWIISVNVYRNNDSRYCEWLSYDIHQDCLEVIEKHHIKIWDIVEIYDDSEYSWMRWMVKDYCIDSNTYNIICNKNINDKHSLWRSEKYLKLIMDDYKLFNYNKTNIWDLMSDTFADSVTSTGDIWISNITSWTLTKDDIIDITKKILNTNNNIMNTNMNTNMNTIEREALEIATEEFFEDKKSIKAIRKADKEMMDMLSLLNKAVEEISKKHSRLKVISDNFNKNYSNKDMEAIKNMLSNHEDVMEFLENFINNKVKDFLVKETKEDFNIEDIFNK